MNPDEMVDYLHRQLEDMEKYLAAAESTWRMGGLLDLPSYRLAASIEGSILGALSAAVCLAERLAQLKTEADRQ